MNQAERQIRAMQMEIDSVNRTMRELERETRNLKGRIGLRSDDMLFKKY